jgi:hypothetical protein
VPKVLWGSDVHSVAKGTGNDLQYYLTAMVTAFLSWTVMSMAMATLTKIIVA